MFEKSNWVKKTIKTVLITSHVGAHIIIILILAGGFYTTVVSHQNSIAAVSLATLITFIMLDTMTILKRYDEKMYEKIYGSYK